MNYNLVVAVCLICCGIQAYARNYLQEACEDCPTECFPFPHPKRCDAFIHCSQRVFRSASYCSPGLCYDESTFICNTCNSNFCEKATCVDDEKLADSNTCNGYFQCENGYFNMTNLQKCPDQFKFNEVTLMCVPNLLCRYCQNLQGFGVLGQYKELVNGLWIIKSCPNNKAYNELTCDCSKVIQHCADNFQLSDIPGTYYQVTSNGLLLRNCAPVSAFNMSTCSCSDVLHQNISSPSCLTINLPLALSVNDINGSYVVSKNISFVNNAAYFNGSSELILSATTNNDFRNNLIVSVNVNIETQMNDIAILSNSNCSGNYNTFSIYVDTSDINLPTLTVFMLIGDNSTAVTLRAAVEFSKWVEINVSKQSNSIVLMLDGQVKVEKTITGTIKINPCPVVLGTMVGKSNFKGLMRQFLLEKCP